MPTSFQGFLGGAKWISSIHSMGLSFSSRVLVLLFFPKDATRKTAFLGAQPRWNPKDQCVCRNLLLGTPVLGIRINLQGKALLSRATLLVFGLGRVVPQMVSFWLPFKTHPKGGGTRGPATKDIVALSALQADPDIPI